MFSWKFFAWTVQKQSSTAILLRKLLQKIPVVEVFFWSNQRLAVQSSDYLLKWLHQECFLGNPTKDFGTPKYQSLDCKYLRQIFFSSKGGILQVPNICLHEKNLSLFSQFPGKFLVSSVKQGKLGHYFSYILLDFKHFQKVHIQISHILPHPPNIHMIPFHTKDNF